MSSALSNSSSKSSSTTTSNNYDQRAGAEDGSIAVSGGGQVNIDATTPEAWDFAADVNADALDLAAITVGSAFGALEKSNQTVGTALVELRKANTSDTANTLEMLIKIGVPVLGAAFILPAIFKK
ncbi:hypothetical protein [Terasakiella sp.]|uniref:hypothetical protein n=1 Tax=Terasakiella sp. TaxID=2034861 RepID=UPI003AA7E812